ncbi:hypothetical protein DVW12_17230 [Clostridium botulinum]|nr:hypothetical protein [Clostridium botulinum]
MGFLVTIINVIRKIVVAKRAVQNGIQKTINIKKIISKALLTYGIIALTVIIFFGTIVYSITGAIKSAMDYLTTQYNTTDIKIICDNIANMTEEEKLAFQETLAFLDPQKIIKYVDKESASIPYGITQTKTTNVDNSITTEQMEVDVSKLTSQYVLPWQVIGAMDVITFHANDVNDAKILTSSDYAKSQFVWANDVTRDDTHYWKEWTVKTRSDGHGTRVTYDGEDTAEEHFKLVKTPLGLAESVSTMFGKYTYNINRDVELLNEPYSARQLVSKESHSTTRHHKKEDGSVKSETITYTTYHYKKTRNTLYEDQATGPTFTFEPTKFIQFLNGSEYKIDDLPLLKLALESLPNTTNILDMIDRIIQGDYKDFNMSTGGMGSTITGLGTGFIPLFHQWDERWGNLMYGGGTMTDTACGPTSAAMVLTGLRGNLNGLDTSGDGILDPYEAACWSVENGYRVPGNGTAFAFFPAIGKAAGLNVREYQGNEYSKVLEELKQGHPVIASMGPGHFTRAGHYIVLVSVLEDGTIKVNDPNREECSLKSWDFNSIIVPEANHYYAFDNPNLKTSDFEATAYTGAADEGGTGTAYGHGITLDGKDLRDKLIAVDPNIIPLGSYIYIVVPESVRYQTMPDRTQVDMNGYYHAVDTGSAIKGNIIDIYFGTGNAYVTLCEEYFGRQNIQVYLN